MSEKDKPETRDLEVSIEIDAPPEAVYKALTEAEELVRWFPLQAGKNEDGSLWMSWDGEHRLSGRTDIEDPPRRVRFVYRQPNPARDPSEQKPDDFAEIATDYTIESRGGKTLLRLVHSGFGEDEDWDDQYEGTRTGWAFELRGLKHYLEHHRGRDRVVGWARKVLACPREEAWSRLMSGEGFLAEGEFNDPREGSRYSIRAVTGDVLQGKILYYEPPGSFVATVEEPGNSLLRVKLDDLYGRRDVNVWLSTYALPESEVKAFESRWQRTLDQLFTA